jgi:hypothetical protein
MVVTQHVHVQSTQTCTGSKDPNHLARWTYAWAIGLCVARHIATSRNQVWGLPASTSDLTTNPHLNKYESPGCFSHDRMSYMTACSDGSYRLRP